MSRNAYKIMLLLIIGLLLLAVLPACSSLRPNKLNMTPMNEMSAEVQSAPVMVQQAYQFAAANPDIMKNIPCYCGCDNIGHTSNYSCYVSGVDAKGAIKFDNHALGCAICVNITQDVMRMTRDGKTPRETRAYIDATYSKYGRSTTTP